MPDGSKHSTNLGSIVIIRSVQHSYSVALFSRNTIILYTVITRTPASSSNALKPIQKFNPARQQLPHIPYLFPFPQLFHVFLLRSTQNYNFVDFATSPTTTAAIDTITDRSRTSSPTIDFAGNQQSIHQRMIVRHKHQALAIQIQSTHVAQPFFDVRGNERGDERGRYVIIATASIITDIVILTVVIAMRTRRLR
ncbi:hypothetical protein ACHAXS_012959 [Conticribra weissflogii]